MRRPQLRCTMLLFGYLMCIPRTCSFQVARPSQLMPAAPVWQQVQRAAPLQKKLGVERAPTLVQRRCGSRSSSRPRGPLLELRSKGGQGEQQDSPEVHEIMEGIAQLQAGIASIQRGLSKTASSAQKAAVSNIAASLSTMQDVVGTEVYFEKLERARDAVLQNMGIAEQLVPKVTGPPFNLATAVWLAGCAFDSYNEPKGGISKIYDDGNKVSFSSSRALAQLHSGVLLIQIKSAELTPKRGLLGAQSARCDPYVTVEVNGALAETSIVTNTLSPKFDTQFVMYAGGVEEDSIRLMLYDADLLMGNPELKYLTPDPLVGIAELPLADIAATKGWVSLDVALEQPDEQTTRADVENAANPYWLKIPREAYVQSWPNLMAGGAEGGTLTIQLQFLPMNVDVTNPSVPANSASASSPSSSSSSSRESGGSAADMLAADWALLAASSADVQVDPELFARQNLERLAFLDNTETDTQVTLWRDSGARRLVLAFRGTEQTRWKDLMTDALVVQNVFEPGCSLDEEIKLPPLLQSATASFSKKIRDGGKSISEAAEREALSQTRETVETQTQLDFLRFVDAGALASLTSVMTEADSLTDIVRRVTGRADYQLGDLSKEALKQMTGRESYEFGDLTRTALQAASKYQFGDISKSVLSLFDDVAASNPLNTQAEAAGEEAASAAEAAAAAAASAVHVGFLRGYLSVRRRLVHMLRVLKEEEVGESWTIYVTGHSLGGALATICAADVAVLFANDKVVMYNYGSPRVGNLQFVNRFNSAVNEAFRVVNDADVVARVPRSRGTSSDNYFHVGRTVLVTNKPGRDVWVEGESDGQDPLAERWIDFSELVEAEVALLQGLVSGASVGDHMEDAYFIALRNALSTCSPPEDVG